VPQSESVVLLLIVVVNFTSIVILFLLRFCLGLNAFGRSSSFSLVAICVDQTETSQLKMEVFGIYRFNVCGIL
jgi:hypothetical protein